MTDTLRTEILLSLQRALFGRIPPPIRGVAVDWNEADIQIVCYFEGPISENAQELMNCVETEVMADFPTHQVKLENRRSNRPAMLKPLKAWVYLKNEEIGHLESN